MRSLPLAAILLGLLGTAVFAAKESPDGALSAIKALPRGEAKRIARIEAREGTPVPERWHIIVHDPKDENGLHEYVVAGGEVVASRAISQFVEFVQPEDIVSASAVRVDSDKVANLAQAYALANKVTITALNYALKKEGAEAAALWSVSCLDEGGKEIGRLVVSAGKGTVVSHEGFSAEPGAEAQIEAVATSDGDSRPRKTVVRVTPVPAVPTAIPVKKKGLFDRLFGSRVEDRR